MSIKTILLVLGLLLSNTIRGFAGDGTIDTGDTAWVTITINDNEDVIPLNAGWNLISTNHTPNTNTMIDIFSSLIPGNLVYVTGFNQGSSLYNPNGLTFLNTLTQFTDGYGYWVKMAEGAILYGNEAEFAQQSLPSPSVQVASQSWNLVGKYEISPMSINTSLAFESLEVARHPVSNDG